jgi:hypothetical protein
MWMISRDAFGRVPQQERHREEQRPERRYLREMVVPEVRRQQREQRDRKQDADERHRRPQRQQADRVGVVRHGTGSVCRVCPMGGPGRMPGRRGGNAAQHQEREGQSQRQSAPGARRFPAAAALRER